MILRKIILWSIQVEKSVAANFFCRKLQKNAKNEKNLTYLEFKFSTENPFPGLTIKPAYTILYSHKI